MRAAQLVRDATGALHVGHVDGGQLAHYEVFDGSWSKAQVLTSADIHVRLAVTAEAAPRLATWTTLDATWKLQYVAPPAAAEVVTPLGSNVLERPHSSLALVGAEATPWVLLARKQADQIHHEVVLAHRTGPNTWVSETLAAEDPIEQTCATPPAQPGEQCDYDYTRVYPLTLLASATELRALYLSVRHQGTRVAECVQVPFPMCWWTPLGDQSTSELRVAWPGSQAGEHAVAALDVFTDRATVRLDTAGNMRLALYDAAPGTGDPVVRYLMIGP